jgi:predicted nuclease with TOPRIM domain
METDFVDYKEMMYDVCRALGNEKESLAERTRLVDGFMRVAEKTSELLSEIDDLKEENERLQSELEEKETEVDSLKAELERKQAEIDNLKLKQQLSEAEAKTPEIHNHFEPGSSAQVFNDKVTGKFSKLKRWKNKDNKKPWRKREAKKA